VAWQNGAERAPNNDLALPPIEMIRLYGFRFKIELSQALRVLGAYAYHFWMRGMPKISRGYGTQHLHRASNRYRATWSGLPSAPDRGEIGTLQKNEIIG